MPSAMKNSRTITTLCQTRDPKGMGGAWRDDHPDNTQATNSWCPPRCRRMRSPRRCRTCHQSCPRLRDLRLRFVKHKSIFNDRGIKRHSLYFKRQVARLTLRYGTVPPSYFEPIPQTFLLARMCKNPAKSVMPGEASKGRRRRLV